MLEADCAHPGIGISGWVVFQCVDRRGRKREKKTGKNGGSSNFCRYGPFQFFDRTCPPRVDQQD